MSDSKSTDLVVGTESQVSVQVFQDVYYSLTGKSERLTKLFYDCHDISIDEIKNLHHVIEQTLEQYEIVASNCFVVVRYADSRSERFSGFSRFETQCSSRSCPTEDVAIEYDFAIALPKTREARPYKLRVGLRSTLGVLKKFEIRNSSDFERRMFFEYDNATARLDLEYVDLAVARNLEAQVETWYGDLKKRNLNSLQKWAGRMKGIAATLMRVMALTLAAALSVAWFSPELTSEIQLFHALSATVASFLALNLLTFHGANAVSKWLGRITEVSVVRLSKADNACMSEREKSTAFLLFRSLGIALLTILTGLITTYLAYKLVFHA